MDDFEVRLSAYGGPCPDEDTQNPVADWYSRLDGEPENPVGNGREDRPGSGTVPSR